MFLHIGIIIGVLLLAGTTLVMQVISIYYDDIETKHSNEAFYKYWANETTKLEDFSGVPEIDFTYPEGRSIKFTEMKVRKVTELPANNHRKIPIWYGYVHCVLSAFVIVCILHAVMWWYLASQPVPSVLLDFCKRDLQMCQQRCSKDFDEEYPLVLNNDLLSLANQVEKAYHHYWSILSVKRQQLKWALGPICISLLFMLIYTFISSIKSFNKRVIKEKSSSQL